MSYEKELKEAWERWNAEPITTEQAIEHLMRTKWLQEHDTAMIEKGMERQKKLNVLEAKLRRGRWIEIRDGIYFRHRCSECKCSVPYDEEKYPICPYCGAKMYEVEE